MDLKSIGPLLLAGLLFLTGCAAFGPGGGSPQLESAYQAAVDALQEAEAWNAPQYRPRMYDRARDRFSVIREQHVNDPSTSLIPKYNQVQILAHRATIDSLVDRVEELQSLLEEKQQQIETETNELQKQNETISKQKKTIQQLRSQNREIQATVEDLRDTAAKIPQLRRRLEAAQEEIQRVEIEEQQFVELRREKSRLERVVSELEIKRDRLERRLDDLEETVKTLRTRLTEKESQLAELREENRSIAQEFQQKIKEAEVRREKNRIIINMQEKVLFDLGDANLKNRAQKTLGKIADILKRYPNRDILVEGHTDDLPIKQTIKDKYASNWELSAQRAINVVKHLIYSRGITADRLAAVAHGPHDPLVPNTSAKNRARNRRVEIVLLPGELLDSGGGRSLMNSDTPPVTE